MIYEFQREALQKMMVKIEEFESGSIDLGTLVSQLRVAYEMAEFHDQSIRFVFERAWIFLDHEHELQTENWAPPDASTAQSVESAITGMRSWIECGLNDSGLA